MISIRGRDVFLHIANKKREAQKNKLIRLKSTNDIMAEPKLQPKPLIPLHYCFASNHIHLGA